MQRKRRFWYWVTPSTVGTAPSSRGFGRGQTPSWRTMWCWPWEESPPSPTTHRSCTAGTLSSTLRWLRTRVSVMNLVSGIFINCVTWVWNKLYASTWTQTLHVFVRHFVQNCIRPQRLRDIAILWPIYIYSVFDNQYAEVIFDLFNLFFNNNYYMITLLIIIMITIVIL